MSGTGNLCSPETTRQALEWLQKHSDELSDFYLWQTFSTDPPDLPIQPFEQLRRTPSLFIAILSDRLEGKIFPKDQLKAHFIRQLQQGGSLEEFTNRSDLFFNVLTIKARHGLNTQPQVYDALLAKTEYLLQLLKICMASALVEYKMLFSGYTTAAIPYVVGL